MIITFKQNKILVIFLVGVFFFAGCASMPTRRDFRRMFAPYFSRIDENPIIIVPGIIGSRLENTETGEIVWGALKVKQLFFLSERYNGALPIDKLPLRENRDKITSKGIIDKYDLPIGILQFTVYRELLDLFEEIGYKFGDIRHPKSGDNLYIFDYDWRRDNVENAILLAKRIENIKRLTGKPDQKFNLICHSNGGLIARYYARYGDNDILDQSPDFNITCAGSKNIKKLILLGPPNLGSMPVFKYLHDGLDLRILNYPPYILFTMPSIYQLLPFREVSSFIDKDGNIMNVDLYDIKNWKKFGWSMYSKKMQSLTQSRYKSKFGGSWKEEFEKFEKTRDRFIAAALERADLFQKSLNFRLKKEGMCETILFGSDTEWTLNRAMLVPGKNGEWRTIFWQPHMRKEMFMPGDTIITRDSLLGIADSEMAGKGWADSPVHISFVLFVTQRHENIHKDPTFQNNLLHVLFSDYISPD